MKLSEILKQNGLFSRDIKLRIKNGQIFVNGEVTTSNIDIPFTGKIFDAGEFIFKLADNQRWLNTIQLVGIEHLSTCNIDNQLTRAMKHFTVIRFSKKDIILVR